jgi:hypothetical protein
MVKETVLVLDNNSNSYFKNPDYQSKTLEHKLKQDQKTPILIF